MSSSALINKANLLTLSSGSNQAAQVKLKSNVPELSPVALVVKSDLPPQKTSFKTYQFLRSEQKEPFNESSDRHNSIGASDAEEKVKAILSKSYIDLP